MAFYQQQGAGKVPNITPLNTTFTTIRQSTTFAPKFPTHALPETVEKLVEEGATAIGCAPDLIALPALVTLGSGIGNSRVVQPKKGWTESAEIYGAVIAASGEKKTAAIGLATKPAKRLEKKLNKEFEQKLSKHLEEMRDYEVERKAAAKDGVSAPPPPERPHAERVWVNDTTIEALIPILKTNPRGLALEKDELVGWTKSMDQYKSGGKGGERQFWLSTWSNSPASVDRKSQLGEPLSVPRPFVSVLGGVQPTVLHELGESRADGMLERFLFVYPEPVNAEWTDDEVSEEAESKYADLYSKLRNLSMQLDEMGDPMETPVGFSQEAKRVFIDAYNAHRREMAQPEFLPHLRSPWAKLEAYLLRLTLIVAACRFAEAEKPTPEQITEDDALRAMVLLDYFKGMARRVFGALYAVAPRHMLVADVVRFVKERGGLWVGTPSELFEQLESPYKPGRVNELSRFLQGDWEEDFGLLAKSSMESYKDRNGKWKNRRSLELYIMDRS